METSNLQHKDREPAEKKMIILWGQDDVLARAVENLLSTRCDWRVLRISDDLDEAALAQVMEQVTPDVLIVLEGVFASNARLFIRFVQDYPRLKIITVGLENNRMEIYNKQTFDIKEASDLLAALSDEAGTEM